MDGDLYGFRRPRGNSLLSSKGGPKNRDTEGRRGLRPLCDESWISCRMLTLRRTDPDGLCCSFGDAGWFSLSTEISELGDTERHVEKRPDIFAGEMLAAWNRAFRSWSRRVWRFKGSGFGGGDGGERWY